MGSSVYTVAIIGCGSRGGDVYGGKMYHSPEHYRVVALCDVNPAKTKYYGENFEVPEENRFGDEEIFFRQKRADLLVIATQDADHVRQCLRALELGYDVLMEKPITDRREECESLLAAQKKYGGKVFVCHVLRYAPAFVKASELIRSGAIGRLVAIDAIEQVTYWHQAHSFVRGNWRRSDTTTPMILAKCCHDLDLLQFYAGSPCRSVSSVGDLTFFTPENAPDGATMRCLDCPHVDTCPYSAKRIYLDRFDAGSRQWPANVVSFVRPLTREAILEGLKTGPYGRCVFHCDNDVVDHQLTTMTFENGVKATLTMTAFTGGGGRKMVFHGTLGEVILNEEEGYVRLRVFGEADQTWSISSLVDAAHGHGGGDDGLVTALYEMLRGEESGVTTLEASVESHLMGIAAERSRLAGGALVMVHSV